MLCDVSPVAEIKLHLTHTRPPQHLAHIACTPDQKCNGHGITHMCMGCLSTQMVKKMSSNMPAYLPHLLHTAVSIVCGGSTIRFTYSNSNRKLPSLASLWYSDLHTANLVTSVHTFDILQEMLQ